MFWCMFVTVRLFRCFATRTGMWGVLRRIARPRTFVSPSRRSNLAECQTEEHLVFCMLKREGNDCLSKWFKKHRWAGKFGAGTQQVKWRHQRRPNSRLCFSLYPTASMPLGEATMSWLHSVWCTGSDDLFRDTYILNIGYMCYGISKPSALLSFSPPFLLGASVLCVCICALYFLCIDGFYIDSGQYWKTHAPFTLSPSSRPCHQ